MKKKTIKQAFDFLNREYSIWWNSTEFSVMERVTGLKQSRFSPEDGYEDFVIACDNIWEDLSLSEKRYYYKQFN